jgi:hypothetical protein
LWEVDPLAIVDIAHAGHGGHGATWALGAVAIAAMVIPLFILGLVGRGFWRAAKRDAADEERGVVPPPGPPS